MENGEEIGSQDYENTSAGADVFIKEEPLTMDNEPEDGIYSKPGVDEDTPINAVWIEQVKSEPEVDNIMEDDTDCVAGLKEVEEEDPLAEECEVPVTPVSRTRQNSDGSYTILGRREHSEMDEEIGSQDYENTSGGYEIFIKEESSMGEVVESQDYENASTGVDDFVKNGPLMKDNKSEDRINSKSEMDEDTPINAVWIKEAKGVLEMDNVIGDETDCVAGLEEGEEDPLAEECEVPVSKCRQNSDGSFTTLGRWKHTEMVGSKTQTSTKVDLYRHEMVHMGKKPFGCAEGEKRSFNKFSFQGQLKVHTVKMPHQCHLCKNRFMHKCNLDAHLKIHTGNYPFPCRFCKEKFRQKCDLDAHLTVHRGDKPFLCHLCEKKYKLKDHLDVHLRVHMGIKQFSCQLCEKKFTQKGTLDVHLRVHSGDKPFQCQLCDKKFRQTNALDYHLRVHTKSKQFPCQFCEKKFRLKYVLNAHLASVHSGNK